MFFNNIIKSYKKFYYFNICEKKVQTFKFKLMPFLRLIEKGYGDYKIKYIPIFFTLKFKKKNYQRWSWKY